LLIRDIIPERMTFEKNIYKYEYIRERKNLLKLGQISAFELSKKKEERKIGKIHTRENSGQFPLFFETAAHIRLLATINIRLLY
jgi:hypothetical protein